MNEAYQLKNESEASKAIKKANHLLKYAERNDRSQIGASYYLLAEIYYNIYKLETALKYTQAAEESLLNSKDFYHLAMNKICKAKIYLGLQKTDEAEKQLSEAKSILKKHNSREYLGNAYIIDGLLYEQLNDINLAIKFYERAISVPFYNKNEQDFLISFTFQRLAENYNNTGNISKARSFIDQSLALAQKNNYKELLLEDLQINSKIYESENKYEESLAALKEYYKMFHELYNPETLLNREITADQAELSFKDELLATRDQKMLENKEKLDKSNLTSIFTSALLIIISLLTISLYRNNQIKVKTNELLVKKNNELLLAKENAVNAMKAKTQFLSTVSHELRTPLYAVTGLTHLLLQENPTENQKEHLKSLKFSGEYLLTFINDILQINKMEAKKLTVQHIPFSLEETMSEVINSLSQTAKENNNTVSLEMDKKIPLQLMGDPLKLSQIFINLVGNALKFTENGRVELFASVISETDKNFSIHFEVNDNGIGISEEVQKNIFESFAQGSIQINRKYGGTGLGLTIVKNLLELLHSDIELKSTENVGSTFSFDITFEKAAETVVVEEVASPDYDIENTLRGLHILLVEDNKINQVITKKMLIQKQITCEIADDGYKAIELAQDRKFDLILMDIHMPGISGLKATSEIRKFNTQIPIIALTAISLDENTDDFFEVGCSDIITKPFKPEEFYKKIALNITSSSNA
ncbi:tetratricopeptide repeat-containing hybrid sensor histidine kinase/response regulator [Pustulibacterium marinum]|nr:response regulator [Pustulibacterium marinum]